MITTKHELDTALTQASKLLEVAYALNMEPRFEGEPCKAAFRAAWAVLGAVLPPALAAAVEYRSEMTGEYDVAFLRAAIIGCERADGAIGSLGLQLLAGRVSVLRCGMRDACGDAVTHVDEKGYVYCKKHGTQRKATCRCRALRPAERKRLEAGQTIGY